MFRPSREEFIQVAAILANDLHTLADKRNTQRTPIIASPLIEVPHSTKNFEAGCRAAWERYIRKNHS